MTPKGRRRDAPGGPGACAVPDPRLVPSRGLDGPDGWPPGPQDCPQGVLGGGPEHDRGRVGGERIALTQGDRWGLKEARPGYFYVVSRGAQRGLVLARWLCWAKAGECVAYANGDRLDLRRANLVAVPEAVFRARVLGRDLEAA